MCSCVYVYEYLKVLEVVDPACWSYGGYEPPAHT